MKVEETSSSPRYRPMEDEVKDLVKTAKNGSLSPDKRIEAINELDKQVENARKVSETLASPAEHARARQVAYWVEETIKQNKKSELSIWLWAKSLYRKVYIGPVENWPLKTQHRVEKLYRELLTSSEFLTPIVRFHLAININPRLMEMAMYARHAAVFHALQSTIEEYFDEY